MAVCLLKWGYPLALAKYRESKTTLSALSGICWYPLEEAGGKLGSIARINSRLVCFWWGAGWASEVRWPFLGNIISSDKSNELILFFTLISISCRHQREFSVYTCGHTSTCKNTGANSPRVLIWILAPQREELIFLGKSTIWYKGKFWFMSHQRQFISFKYYHYEHSYFIREKWNARDIYL